MLEAVQQVLGILGFLTHPIDFKTAVPYDDLRKRLSGPYRDTPVSHLLRHLPDLFVMHSKIDPGIFFVKVTPPDTPLPDEAKDVYSEYYPDDLLLASGRSERHGTRIVGRWIGESAGEVRPLSDALRDRFGFEVTEGQSAKCEAADLLI